MMPIDAQIMALPVPECPMETPCLVIIEAAVVANIRKTIERAGGVKRLMPHVKTHRAPWIVALHIKEGVSSFKCATPAEVEMCLAAGAKEVLWAYPTANEKSISRVLNATSGVPKAQIIGLVDSKLGVDAWLRLLRDDLHSNISLMVDIDPGMGRTGIPLGGEALALANTLHEAGRFDGWHVYDGHIQNPAQIERREKVEAFADSLRTFFDQDMASDLSRNVIGAGSWTYDLWPTSIMTRVSPGSYVYTSTQHQAGLPEHSWRIGAYVLSSVVSQCGNTVTLDAGSKAISPDMKMHERFLGAGQIVSIKEEHSVVQSAELSVGMTVPLVPRHACTTAYLYQNALVLSECGAWVRRPQLGNQR